MIEFFEKAFWWTMVIGFGAVGVLTGLMVLRIAIGVAGVLMGSTLGTIVLAWFIYMAYKRIKKSEKKY